MPSRIPVLDALAFDVPAGADVPEHLRDMTKGQSRWYPQPDGSHRVLILQQGRPYDPAHLTLMPGAWDHDTCDICTVRIPAMTLCYVTSRGHYIGLCMRCYAEHVVRRLPWSRKIAWYVGKVFGNERAA